MFKLELTDHKLIKNAFESISHIVDEITLTADSEALHLKCLSRDHITFITMDLEKTVFDEYQCDVPEKIAIDCTEFMKILKRLKNSDILELNLDNTKNTFNIIMKGDAVRKFNIQLIDMEYDNPTPPEINLPCTVNLPSDLLKSYVEDIEVFSDKLYFIVDENYLKVQSSGELGDAEIEYLHGENISSVVRSQFSIPKLKDILRSNKFSKEITLEIGEDMPIKVSLKLPAGDGELNYLLAPRLETEE